MIGIYKIENLINGKVYIGKSKNIENRWRTHKKELNNNSHCNKHLQNAWNKYGKENFKFEVIEECSMDLLDKQEIYWISEYNSNCYNLTKGGDGVVEPLPEVIDKMRNSLIAYYQDNPVPEETRKKLSIAGKGRIVSEETKRRISETEKGWQPSIETRLKMSISAKGKKLSEETKEKISNFQKGRPKPKTEAHIQHHRESLLGRMNGPRSDETKQKISNSKKGKPLSEQHKQALKEAWVRRKANGKGTAWNKGLTKQKVEE